MDSKFFGFVQFDLAGALPLADGRYVVRDDGEETVLVVETLDAPTARRRRRRPRQADPEAAPATLPLSRVTVIRSADSFGAEEDAGRWHDGIKGDEAAIDALAAGAAATLNRALHVHAVVSQDPHQPAISPERASTVRVGYGSGEQVASGEWTRAIEIDPSRPRGSLRHRRSEELRPQERLTAILGGREQLDACETLLLRARADLDAGRPREAALQLRIALDALLQELPDTLDDPDHIKDIVELKSRRSEATDAADAALQGDLDSAQLKSVEDLLQLCERVLRRRRVLRG
ncbi:MAG: hypothetical protein ACM3N0_00040 [Chloroflexota bacterium]